MTNITESIHPDTHRTDDIYQNEVTFRVCNIVFLVKSGDSIYFNAKASKEVVNNYDGLSEMLWIQSPASL